MSAGLFPLPVRRSKANIYFLYFTTFIFSLLLSVLSNRCKTSIYTLFSNEKHVFIRIVFLT